MSLVLAAVLISAVTAAGGTNRPTEWAKQLQVEGVKNLWQVSDKLYRSGQPTAQGMTNLAAMGIRTIVNLRSSHSDKDRIGKLPMRYRHIRTEAWDVGVKDAVSFAKLMADTNNHPVLVHCYHGSDRTGAMVALYRIIFEGWTRDAAAMEMEEGDFGFHSVWAHLIEWIRDVDLTGICKKAGIDRAEKVHFEWEKKARKKK